MSRERYTLSAIPSPRIHLHPELTCLSNSKQFHNLSGLLYLPGTGTTFYVRTNTIQIAQSIGHGLVSRHSNRRSYSVADCGGRSVNIVIKRDAISFRLNGSSSSSDESRRIRSRLLDLTRQTWPTDESYERSGPFVVARWR